MEARTKQTIKDWLEILYFMLGIIGVIIWLGLDVTGAIIAIVAFLVFMAVRYLLFDGGNRYYFVSFIAADKHFGRAYVRANRRLCASEIEEIVVKKVGQSCVLLNYKRAEKWEYELDGEA